MRQNSRLSRNKWKHNHGRPQQPGKVQNYQPMLVKEVQVKASQQNSADGAESAAAPNKAHPLLTCHQPPGQQPGKPARFYCFLFHWENYRTRKSEVSGDGRRTANRYGWKHSSTKCSSCHEFLPPRKPWSNNFSPPLYSKILSLYWLFTIDNVKVSNPQPNSFSQSFLKQLFPLSFLVTLKSTWDLSETSGMPLPDLFPGCSIAYSPGCLPALPLWLRLLRDAFLVTHIIHVSVPQILALFFFSCTLSRRYHSIVSMCLH